MKMPAWMFVVVVTVCAVPALAQKSVEDMRPVGDGSWSNTSTYSLGEYMDNPCTAVQDWIWVSYDVSLYQEGKLTSSGDERVLFSESTAVDGGYIASGSSQSDVIYKQQPYTLRKYHKVNTADDFHVVTAIDFDPATNGTTVRKETACGNGMPDSAQ